MTLVSLELVPRSLASLDADLALVRQHFSALELVNIPDLLRFDVRSWDACARARATVARAVPHLRAMDFRPDRPLPMDRVLTESAIRDVLVVQGDPPPDMTHSVHPTTPVELIRSIRLRHPELRVYAALDPYRSSFRDELQYLERKREAGAVGVFTQPFFDRRLMDVWWDLLIGESDLEVFWGVSPVLSAGSRRYWETRNRGFFPSHFEPTLAWNRAFASDALHWVRERDTNVYFMPIRTDLVAYLSGIL